MNICINGQLYTLTDEQQAVLTSLFHGKIEQEYDKLDPTYRLVAKGIARGALAWIEERVKQEAGLEASIKVRPAKKADPVPHLLNLGERLLGDMMAHVTISFETTEGAVWTGFNEVGELESKTSQGAITGFTVTLTGTGKSEDGRSVDSDGHIRIRQDDRLEVPGQYVHEAVS
jgi:hypothetical protein